MRNGNPADLTYEAREATGFTPHAGGLAMNHRAQFILTRRACATTLRIARVFDGWWRAGFAGMERLAAYSYFARLLDQCDVLRVGNTDVDT